MKNVRAKFNVHISCPQCQCDVLKIDGNFPDPETGFYVDSITCEQGCVVEWGQLCRFDQTLIIEKAEDYRSDAYAGQAEYLHDIGVDL